MCAVVLLLTLIVSGAAFAEGLQAQFSELDLAKTAPGDAVWNSIDPYTVSLVPQQMVVPRGGGSVAEVQARALYSGEKILVHLRWKDDSADLLSGVDRFRDAAAVQFPVNPSGAAPSPFMGDPANPVNIWQWRADWQTPEKEEEALGLVQPAAAGVWYSPLDQDILKTRYPKKPTSSAAALEYIAAGWGTLTKQVQQDIAASSEYKDGFWSVVFLRDLARADESDAAFSGTAKSFINFAVWNGKQSEVNGIKSVSMTWHNFELAARPKSIVSNGKGLFNTGNMILLITALMACPAAALLYLSLKQSTGPKI